MSRLDWSTVFGTKESVTNYLSRIRKSISEKIELLSKGNSRNTNLKSNKEKLRLTIQDMLNNYRSKDRQEVATEHFTEIIKLDFESNRKRRTQKTNSKITWWNNSLDFLRARMRRAWTKVKNPYGNFNEQQVIEEQKRLQKVQYNSCNCKKKRLVVIQK